MATALGRGEIEPEVTGSHRAGDIRHSFADISRARAVLGYEPAMPFEQGLRGLAAWLEGQAADDRVAEAHAELAARGLTA
jgi:dTDP-L-rhamnose 4-epimerase